MLLYFKDQALRGKTFYNRNSRSPKYYECCVLVHVNRFCCLIILTINLLRGGMSHVISVQPKPSDVRTRHSFQICIRIDLFLTNCIVLDTVSATQYIIDFSL